MVAGEERAGQEGARRERAESRRMGRLQPFALRVLLLFPTGATAAEVTLTLTVASSSAAAAAVAEEEEEEPRTGAAAKAAAVHPLSSALLASRRALAPSPQRFTASANSTRGPSSSRSLTPRLAGG